MDEVDFTILAATSVLGDLIEKCPPAEACRDAFDRMSKATVQMCMSTTGFGSSANPQGLNSRHSNSRSQPHQGQTSDSSQSQNQNSDYFNAGRPYRRQSRGPSGRPKPQFDMGLNDLLGSPQPASLSTPTMQSPQPSFRPASRNSDPNSVKMEYDPFSQQRGHTSQGAGQAQSIGHASPQSIDFAISPPLSSLDTSAIDPSLLPSSFYNPSNQAQNQAVYQEMQFAPGMDFLQGGWDGNNGAAGAYTGDIGMGMGWEGADHDFSEGGNGVDLFDGFFFGGSGNF